MATNLLSGRRVIGGVAVAAAALGIYLGSKLGGFGIGGGGSGGIGTGQDGKVSVSADPNSENRPDPPAEKPDPKPSTVTVDQPLDVIVDGSGYALRQDAGDVPTTLPQVVALVKDVRGGRDGIRVRVFRRGNALPSAETALDEALREAEIPATSIHKVDELLD